MTKYEWFSELKKNIHRLPNDEIKRVTEYYDELFEDNIERGKSEREIIGEFGNPSDVAYKILSEYDGELKSEDSIDAPPKRSDKRRDKFDRDFDDKDEIFERHKDIKSGGGGIAVIDEPREKSSASGRNIKIAVFIIVNLVTGFAPLFIALALWIVLVSFTVAGAAMALGGVAAVFVSFGPMFTGMFGSGLAQLGMSLALLGVGLALAMLCAFLIKQYARFTVFCFKSIF